MTATHTSVQGARPGHKTNSCVNRDLALERGRIALTSDAVLLDTCNSGVVFDCFAGEGFWVFMDPRDTGSYTVLGVEMRSTEKNTSFLHSYAPPPAFPCPRQGERGGGALYPRWSPTARYAPAAPHIRVEFTSDVESPPKCSNLMPVRHVTY